MMLIANRTPRPYVADFALPSGERLSERVEAYDIQEAIFSAITRVTARGFVGAKLVDVGPDASAARAVAEAEQRQAAADFVAGLLKTAPSMKDLGKNLA